MLPETFEKDRIFAFLGQLHIVGKKDWGTIRASRVFISPTCKRSVSQEEIATDIGLPLSEVKNLIKTYEFMHMRWRY